MVVAVLAYLVLKPKPKKVNLPGMIYTFMNSRGSISFCQCTYMINYALKTRAMGTSADWKYIIV